MKSTLTVGPIKKAEKKNVAYESIRKQMNDMKVGEYFEVSGVSKKSALAVRAAISYYSKRDKCMVTTQLAGSKLIVERVRAAKTSNSSLVQDTKK
jgi:hypothetical protein